MYIYIYICINVCICVYIYIYIYILRRRAALRLGAPAIFSTFLRNFLDFSRLPFKTDKSEQILGQTEQCNSCTTVQLLIKLKSKSLQHYIHTYILLKP